LRKLMMGPGWQTPATSELEVTAEARPGRHRGSDGALPSVRIAPTGSRGRPTGL